MKARVTRSRSRSGRRFATGLVAAFTVAALAACTSSTSPDSTTTSSTAQKPVRGGTLTIGMVGGGAGESIDPGIRSASISVARAWALYEGLYKRVLTPDNYLAVEPAAASAVDKTGPTTYLVTIRDGLKFSDGTLVKPQDVAWSINRTLDPANGLQDTPTLQLYFPKDPAVVTGTKVTITTKFEIGDQLALQNQMASFYVMPDGTKKITKPVGTGPWKYESFAPGDNSVFVRNTFYRDPDRPYYDKLVLRSVPDSTARLNALLSQQVDAMETIDLPQARQYKDSPKITVLRAPGFGFVPFYMRVDTKPFDDVRVRQALKLLINRKEMVDTSLQGFGTIAKDVPGQGVTGFDTTLPEVPFDQAKARELLKQAGYDNNLTVELLTSKAGTGMLESAQVLKEQAKAVGVTINLRELPPDQYFNTETVYLKAPFAQSAWGADFLTFAQNALISNAPYNETHFKDPAFDAAIEQASKERDPAARDAILFPLERKFQTDSGYIIWGFQDQVDAALPTVKGIVETPNQVGLGGYQFENWWSGK